MDLDLECLASFVELAREQHYGRAATRLHISASALTKRVQRLERQLGVRLIDRGPAGVADVTKAGTLLVDGAGPLLAHVGSLRRQVRAEPKQVLALGVHGAVGDYPTFRELAAVRGWLHQRTPDIALRVVAIPYHTDPIVLLRERVVDVIWTSGEVDTVATDCRRLAPMSRFGIVSHRHHLADAPSIPVSTFVDLTIIRNPAAPSYWMDQFCFGDVRPMREASLTETVTFGPALAQERAFTTGSVVATHQGYADRLAPGMRMIPLTGVPIAWFCAVSRKSDRRTPTRALIDGMADTALGTLASLT